MSLDKHIYGYGLLSAYLTHQRAPSKRALRDKMLCGVGATSSLNGHCTAFNGFSACSHRDLCQINPPIVVWSRQRAGSTARLLF